MEPRPVALSPYLPSGRRTQLAAQISSEEVGREEQQSGEEARSGLAKAYRARWKIASSRERKENGQQQGREVRVRKDVRTEREQVRVPMRHEEVSVEQVPVEEGREASEAEIGEDEVTMPVTEEEVVTEKRPVVKEELRIRKDAVQDEEVVEEDVRREEVDIEDATKRRREGETAQTDQTEERAEEERPGREETGREEDFIEKAKRKIQGQ